nr:hypothetical protein GCM10020092_092090 [Actinoplanes digitatis]
MRRTGAGSVSGSGGMNSTAGGQGCGPAGTRARRRRLLHEVAVQRQHADQRGGRSLGHRLLGYGLVLVDRLLGDRLGNRDRRDGLAAAAGGLHRRHGLALGGLCGVLLGCGGGAAAGAAAFLRRLRAGAGAASTASADSAPGASASRLGGRRGLAPWRPGPARGCGALGGIDGRSCGSVPFTALWLVIEHGALSSSGGPGRG